MYRNNTVCVHAHNLHPGANLHPVQINLHHLEGRHGKLFLTGIDIRFDNVIAFIDFSNCLPLIDTAIIGKVN